MPGEWLRPAASMIAYRAGSCSAISPCQATSTSSSVQVSLKAAACRFGADGRGIGLVAVEGRVKVDQVYRLRVHTPQDVEVVAGPQGAVVPVGRPLNGGHFLFPRH